MGYNRASASRLVNYGATQGMVIMKRILIVCLLSGLCALDIFAQAGISAITGTVRDASGGGNRRRKGHGR
jgi:hypothetical protein